MWKTRSFISLLSFWSFCFATLTGIILYFTPAGRIAYWIDWRFLQLTKTQWGSLHILFCLLFVISGVWHVVYNWRPLLGYFKRKSEESRTLSRELAVSLVLTLTFAVGTLALWQPFKAVVDLGTYLSDSWVADASYEPPFGHAELLSLSGFIKKMDIDGPQAKQALLEAGVVITSPEQTLAELALANQTSPRRIYLLMKPFEKQVVAEAGVVYTPEMVETQFAGTGIGNKTLAEIATMTGVPLELFLQRMEAKGWSFDQAQGLKQLASAAGVNPIDLLKVLLVE